MAAKYPSSTNRDILSSKIDVELCPLDQREPGSCTSSSCFNLHICRDYLLNKHCPEFKSNGKCQYSHSLFTRHNQQILKKKFNLSARDKDTFDTIADYIRTLKSHSSEKISNRSSNIDDDDDRELQSTNKQTSSIHNGRVRNRLPQHTSEPLPARKISLTNTGNMTMSSFVPSLTNSDYPQNSLSKSMDFSSKSNQSTSSLPINSINNYHGQDLSTMNSLSVFQPGNNNGNHSLLSKHASSSRHRNSSKSPVRDMFSRIKEKLTSKPDSNDTNKNDSQLKYIFDKYVKDDELSYLHGPVRRDLIERRGYQVSRSGYCRLTNPNQEKEIEDLLNIMLPITLKTDRVQFSNDDLSLFICTSAAERIFELNQITYSIISHPYSAEFSIEVIRMAQDDHRARSASSPSRKIISTHPSNDPHRATPDDKFRISQTNSSIDVIQGDITNVQVDLIVCVSTSKTLLNSVFKKAGQSIISEYKRQSSTSRGPPILLDGGHTEARKILFISWELEVERSNLTRAQESLSKLVKQCIDEAHRLKMTSIAFPSIGTGEIGLDSNTVSETMINAAKECLHKYKMDVLFVIYPATGSEPNRQSYQAFRSYLNDLCRDSSGSIKAEASSKGYDSRVITISIEKSEHIHRNQECKQISTVSDSPVDHRQLVLSLDGLTKEKTYELYLVQEAFIKKVESIVELCLYYHILPRINFPKNTLVLRGDPDSCLQCFANLRNQRKIHNYGISEKIAKNDEKIIKFSMHISMKIDEAFANDLSDIRLEDGDKTIFHINLHSFTIKINDNVQDFELYREQLNADSKISLPSSWSPLLMIRTVDGLHSSSNSKECRLFERTMPTDKWRIDRIESIENWPLYVHYQLNRVKDEILAFHGCSYSSVQSIIHYGLHSNFGGSSENLIYLTNDALSSHIRNGRRSIDGKYYMFIVRLSKKLLNPDSTNLSNENAHLAFPTHLIVYRRETIVS